MTSQLFSHAQNEVSLYFHSFFAGILDTKSRLAHPDGGSLHLHFGPAVHRSLRSGHSDLVPADKVPHRRGPGPVRVPALH